MGPLLSVVTNMGDQQEQTTVEESVFCICGCVQTEMYSSGRFSTRPNVFNLKPLWSDSNLGRFAENRNLVLLCEHPKQVFMRRVDDNVLTSQYVVYALHWSIVQKLSLTTTESCQGYSSASRYCRSPPAMGVGRIFSRGGGKSGEISFFLSKLRKQLILL